MLLPVAAPSEPGGSPLAPSRRVVDLIAAVAQPGETGLREHRLPSHEPEGAGPAVEVASTATGPAAEPHRGMSQRIARWEPVARAIGHAVQAVVGFLRSVGVPQAEAEDIARRIAEAARERVTIDPHAAQAHFETGRLSLKLEKVEVGFRGSGRPEVEIGKAEVGIDVELPGARREETGVRIGRTEAEIGGRLVAFDYKGPGATTAYVDRGAAGLSFDAAAPVSPPPAAGTAPGGPVDVAI